MDTRDPRARRATQAQVAERLGLSVRQIERSTGPTRLTGAEADLQEARATSPRRLGDATRAEVLTLVR
nr:hypothetical protein [Deltaproteobacteria bacterium]